MVEVLRAHDLPNLSSSSTDPDDWLAHDYDVDSPVYLLVYPAHQRVVCRWGIAWPVGGEATSTSTAAWRHVQLESLADPLGGEVEMHYGYYGALTKTAGPEFATARWIALGTMNLAHRREIESLAKTTPVREDEDGWGCEDWVKDLLERMIAAGVVSATTCHDAVSRASADAA
ncbi:hypothetical protein OH76DRAFT_1400238 [Lentinus brumalis]|uniref:Uncharacterized protein n=1 Tax=Lentinus brumalis TaxID=2498619 RepID=A0A371DIU6_9APHY|nr:hypothetical protein OH76DRAFT_1400238 [Polyporus brumalis]